MDKSTQSARPAKPDYQTVLKQRAQEVFETIDEQVGGALAQQAPDIVDYIRDILKETALESWKNGLQAGRNRLRKQPSGPVRSA
jgi:hypothetical protein